MIDGVDVVIDAQRQLSSGVVQTARAILRHLGDDKGRRGDEPAPLGDELGYHRAVL